MNIKYSTEQVRQFAQARGLELLSEYKNAHSKITIKCRCGTIYETRWNDLREGKSCKSCGYKKVAESRKADPNLVVAKFEESGCCLLSEYESNYKISSIPLYLRARVQRYICQLPKWTQM